MDALLTSGNLEKGICPICGSDMSRDKTDNPHESAPKHMRCNNPNCGICAMLYH